VGVDRHVELLAQLGDLRDDAHPHLLAESTIFTAETSAPLALA
jgi:hypothetical protein